MANQEKKMVWCCSTCGYIYQNTKSPEECPICHGSRSVFRAMKLEDVKEKHILESFEKHVRWVATTFYQFKVKLNPNKNVVLLLARQELRNLKTYGQVYCPCRLRSGNFLADRKIICPCIFYPGEVETHGMCHCRLYFKE